MLRKKLQRTIAETTGYGNWGWINLFLRSLWWLVLTAKPGVWHHLGNKPAGTLWGTILPPGMFMRDYVEEVNWGGKTHSQSGQHQSLGWDAELRKWTEHLHSSLCFLTTPTMWPTVPSLDFSTIMDYSFELWTEINPYSLEVLSSVYFSTAANITLSNVPTDIPGKLARNAVFQLSPFCRSLSHIRHFNWSEWLICALMFRSMIAKSAT